MFFNKLFVFKRVEEPVPPDSGQNGGEVVRKMPKVPHDAKILQEEAGKGLVGPEAFKTPEAIMAALFPRYKEVEIREILGRKYNVLLGVLKGRIEARQQIFLGFKIAHDDVLVIWQQGEKKEEMSLRSVCGIQLNDIAGFMGKEYQTLLSRAEKSMRNMEKLMGASKFLLRVGFEEMEIREILTDRTNPYLTWFLDFIDNMPRNGFEYGAKQSKYILAFRKLPEQKGKKEIFYREKYVDFALNWKKLIYPGLKKISKGFDFKERVLPLIVKKNPVIEAAMVNILEGLPIGVKERENLSLMFSGAVYDSNNKVQTQVDDDADNELPESDDDKLERLLVDPELRDLNDQRKNLLVEKVSLQMPIDAVSEVRNELVQHLNELAVKSSALGPVNERIVAIIPDIEKFIDEEGVNKDLEVMDVLAKFMAFLNERDPEIKKLMDALPHNGSGTEELYVKTFFDMILVRILSTNVRQKSLLLEYLSK